MKKTILCILLICALLISGFSAGVSASADEVDSEENTQEPMTILELLQQNRKENEDLIYSVEFHESMEGLDLSYPLLMVQRGNAFGLMDGRPPEEVMEAFFEKKSCRITFLLFSEPVRTPYFNYERTSISVGLDFASMYFVEELQTGLVRQTFLGEECVISDVFVYIRDSVGTAIIYKTDKGDFVRFYENRVHPTPVEFTWEDFSEYAYEHYAREMEEVRAQASGGGVSPFLEFVEEYKAEKEAQRQEELAARQRKILYISIGAVAVLATAVTAVFLLRRKKKRDIVAE